MAPALFFVSTGRTGTTWLQQVFEVAGARSFHEPGPRIIRNASNAHAAERLSDDRARSLVRRWRWAQVVGPDTPYVEASTLAYGLVRPILDVFPDARVVQVVRDPRTYVRSAMDWGQYRLAGRPLNLVPFRRLAPTQRQPLSLRVRVDWTRKGQFERLCWAWTAMNGATREQGRDDPRFRTIPFEDLTGAEGPTILAGLVSELGLEVSRDQLDQLVAKPENVNPKRKYPQFEDWPQEHQQRLITDCGDEADRYGYDLRT